MNLTSEQRQVGKDNFFNALGVTRRDLVKTAAVAPVAGAFYFSYKQPAGNPVRAGLIGSGSQGGLLLTESNPDFLQFVAYSDIRPSQIERIKHGDPDSSSRIGFLRKYELSEEQFQREIRFYDDYHLLLGNPEIELVVIALPLHAHYQAVMDALHAGKHVFCEKLMAREVSQCKEMARLAKEKGLYLATGHQRHYNMLYDNALSLINDNLLGDIRHIRAQWHRNHSWPRMENGQMEQADGKVQLKDSWRREISEADAQTDFKRFGYKSLEELCWWPLFKRTSGGLMAELGSHQLDACSIFLGNVHPLAVSGVGGKYYCEDEREVDDHVFVTFEFPGFNHPLGKNRGTRENDIVVVSYSAIETNSIDRFGEQVMGTRGTLIVEDDQEVMLFKEPAPGENAPARDTKLIITSTPADEPVLDTSESLDAPTTASGYAQALLSTGVSRGYREELEHLAYCIRNPEVEDQPRCHPQIALASAVSTLTANRAIHSGRRIEFSPAWFDIDSDEVPV